MKYIETLCENCGDPMIILTDSKKLKTYHCWKCAQLLQKQMGYKIIVEKTTGDITKDAEHNTKTLKGLFEIAHKKKILDIFIKRGRILDKEALDRFAKISLIDGLDETKLLIDDLCKCKFCKYKRVITHPEVMEHVKEHPSTI